MQPTDIAANWEKLGIVGLLILAVALLVYSVMRLVKYMLAKHEETTKALREEISRREAMITSHQTEIVKLVENVTAGTQRAVDVVEKNNGVLAAVARVLERCNMRQNNNQTQTEL